MILHNAQCQMWQWRQDLLLTVQIHKPLLIQVLPVADLLSVEKLHSEMNQNLSYANSAFKAMIENIVLQWYDKNCKSYFQHPTLHM